MNIYDLIRQMVGDVIYLIVFIILLALSTILYISSISGQNIICSTGSNLCSISSFFIREGKSRGSACINPWECLGWNPLSSVDCCTSCVTKNSVFEPCYIYCLSNNCNPISSGDNNRNLDTGDRQSLTSMLIILSVICMFISIFLILDIGDRSVMILSMLILFILFIIVYIIYLFG